MVLIICNVVSVENEHILSLIIQFCSTEDPNENMSWFSDIVIYPESTLYCVNSVCW